MAAVDRHTFAPISGWPEVVQGLEMCLTTPRMSRVMRRLFGTDDTELLDRPMNVPTISGAFVAIAEAIEPREINGFQYGEPRFDLVQIVPTQGDESGHLSFTLTGLYYPRGHLGDFSAFEMAEASFVVGVVA
ncbi:MAG: baseplate assembly protein [Devosia sp.]